jgi:hypothetical protein
MSSTKVIVVLNALLLALFVGYRPMPASAQVVPCDPLDPLADCDGDGIPNGTDTCNNLDPTADCDNDGIPNGTDTCNNLDALADCDGDGVANGVDQCPATIVGGDLMIGDIPLSGFGDTILPTGCSLAESLAGSIKETEGWPRRQTRRHARHGEESWPVRELRCARDQYPQESEGHHRPAERRDHECRRASGYPVGANRTNPKRAGPLPRDRPFFYLVNLA